MRKTKIQEIRKEAVRDFYGIYNKNIVPLQKYLTKRNKPILTKEQKEDLWYIKKNLTDETYKKELLKSLEERSLRRKFSNLKGK